MSSADQFSMSPDRAPLGADGRARLNCQAASNRREESSTINGTALLSVAPLLRLLCGASMSLGKGRFAAGEEQQRLGDRQHDAQSRWQLGIAIATTLLARRRADYRTRARLCSGSGIGLRPRYKD
jgi:hypothetical protein